MFQKSRLFIVIGFCCSLEKQLCMLALPTETAIEMKGRTLEILKRPQVIPRHCIMILWTFNLSHVSTEIANSLKPMENNQKLQLWVNLLFLEQLTFCGETLLVGLIFIKITPVQPLKQQLRIVMIVMRNGWPTKGVKPYLQSRTMSQILTIANLWHATSRIRACAKFQALLKEVAQ